MPEDRIWLIPLDGGAPIEIKKPLILVGRQENCDLKLDHKTVSKTHCVLARGDGSLLLRDLGSTNGCRVNGQRQQRGALIADDVLSIAVFEYRVHLGAEPPAPKAPAAVAADRTEMIDVGSLAPADDDSLHGIEARPAG